MHSRRLPCEPGIACTTGEPVVRREKLRRRPLNDGAQAVAVVAVGAMGEANTQYRDAISISINSQENRAIFQLGRNASPCRRMRAADMLNREHLQSR